jgi:hypothetical protein
MTSPALDIADCASAVQQLAVDRNSPSVLPFAKRLAKGLSMDPVVEDFLHSWSFVRRMTYDFIAAVDDAHWLYTPLKAWRRWRSSSDI